MKIIPSRKPQPVTYSQYERYTPEKLELVQGDLLWSDQERIDLLMLLLYNVGLEAFIQQLPPKSISELKSLLECSEKKDSAKTTKGLKRTRKRNPLQPHTKVNDWGIQEILDKMDKAIEKLYRKW
ncbi:hypothetical protein T260_02445 [Geobacillus thermopakistaniensis]|uniref:Uncharacterized protein n=1 Tax=Geobacillus thermopakistaniensis (strain MAS1) TaxID=1408282 RepID=A0A7U9P7D9_GEOTM|nr:hypothetical protein [Geobacillus sp. MAS1]ESU73438.1 hypothetical protein T260_02445 [Geobacillus sp. MAS1]